MIRDVLDTAWNCDPSGRSAKHVGFAKRLVCNWFVHHQHDANPNLRAVVAARARANESRTDQSLRYGAHLTDDAAKAGAKSHVGLPDGMQPWDSGLVEPDRTFQQTFTVPALSH